MTIFGTLLWDKNSINIAEALVETKLCESKSRARELLAAGTVGIQEFKEDNCVGIFKLATKIRDFKFDIDLKNPKLLTCGKKARVVCPKI